MLCPGAKVFMSIFLKGKLEKKKKNKDENTVLCLVKLTAIIKEAIICMTYAVMCVR